MKDLFTVSKFTFKEIVKRKSFIIVTIVFMALIVIAANVPNAINLIKDKDNTKEEVKKKDEYKIYIYDEANLLENKFDDVDSILENEVLVKKEKADIKALSKLVNDHKVTAVFIVEGIKDNNIVISQLRNLKENFGGQNQVINNFDSMITSTIVETYKNKKLEDLNLSQKELEILNKELLFNYKDTYKTKGDVKYNQMLPYIVMFIIFFAILFSAVNISTQISQEKTSKIVETLITSTEPRNIIVGKVFGVGLSGLLQITLFILTALLSIYLFLPKDILKTFLDNTNVSFIQILIFIFYYIFGYLIYGFFFALAGASTTKPEEAQQATQPISFILTMSIYASMYSLFNLSSTFSKITSYVPFTSPFVNVIKALSKDLTLFDIIMPMISLILFTALIAWFAIRVYERVIINYGSRVKFFEMFKLVGKDKE